VATGVDHNRISMILAVLEKRVGLRMADKDVFVNVAGGLKLVEPAVDLAVALAVASSHRDIPVDEALVVAGEVGLAGEIRAVQQMDKRLKEAARMGFTRALVAGRATALPAGGKDGFQVEEVTTLRDAIQMALVSDLARESF
jgi:DNA repair protein RadA/Sms